MDSQGQLNRAVFVNLYGQAFKSNGRTALLCFPEDEFFSRCWNGPRLIPSRRAGFLKLGLQGGGSLCGGSTGVNVRHARGTLSVANCKIGLNSGSF